MDLAVPFNLFHPFMNVLPGSPDPSATTAPDPSAMTAPASASTAGSSASVKATRTRQDTRQIIFLI